MAWHECAVNDDLQSLSPRDLGAVLNAVEKLIALGPDLCFPHQSAVRGTSPQLRELRLRAGRSQIRILYARTGATTFTLLALAPEAETSPRGFVKAIATASRRLETVT